MDASRPNRITTALANVKAILDGDYPCSSTSSTSISSKDNAMESANKLEAIHGWAAWALTDFDQYKGTRRSKKLWGWWTPIFESPAMEIAHADIVAGGHSSWHRHARKHNLFLIRSGLLKIELADMEVILSPVPDDSTWQSYLVPFGFWHRFVALEPTEAVEVYVAPPGGIVTPGEGDIERRDTGGVMALDVEHAVDIGGEG